MNLSFDHDHVGYLGPKAGSSLQTGRPTVPQTSTVQVTSQSRLATPHRNAVSYDTTGLYSNVSFQQSTQIQYRHVQITNGQEYYAKQEQQDVYGNQGNSLNLSGLLREPTPEPVQEIPETKKEEVEIKAEPVDTSMDGDIDIGIRNVVCNYTLPLHIDLRRYALASGNVTYDRGKGVLLKQNRNPGCYIKIYSSGKVYIVGCKSEIDAMRAARTVARSVQRAMGKTNEVVKIRNYKVCNVLATCKMPFGVKIEELAQKYPAESQYEPELSVGLVWRSTSPKGTLRIHTTGSITITGAQSEAAVMELIEIIYPIVREFRCYDRHRGADKKTKKRKANFAAGPAPKKSIKSGAVGNKMYFSDEDDLYDDDDLDDLDD